MVPRRRPLPSTPSALLPLPLLLLPGLAACGGGGGDGGGNATPPPPPPRVIVVVVDTLRRDALGCYGHPGEDGEGEGATPAIDALAADGTRFDQAIATSGWTLPSVASLLTGTWPSVHKAMGRSSHLTPISEDVPTAAEVLAQAGFRTAAVANAAFLSPMLGLDRGFEVFDHRPAFHRDMRRADVSLDAALALLDERRGEPLFLLVHLFDPHLDYDPPGDLARAYTGGRTEPAPPLTREACFGLVRPGGRRPERADVAYLRGVYQGEVAFVDRAIGRLRRALEERGLYAETTVVLTADHGEEFWEHGGFEHGHSLHDELVRVPLIVKPPRSAGPVAAACGTQVRVLDVMPTVFDLVGVEAPPSFVGASLLPLMRGAALPDRIAFCESTLYGPPMRALRDGEWTYIVGTDPQARPREQLYHRGEDPGEERDLMDERPEQAAVLRGRMDAFLGELERAAALTRRGQRREISPRTLEEYERSLRSLGYAGRDDDDGEDGDGDGEDRRPR